MLDSLFEASTFMPHGHCYLWRPDILWLNVGSDVLISVAYFIIPAALIVLVKKRSDIKFNWMFFLFAAFILGCGVTHVIEIVTVWQPYYMLQGVAKLCTAVFSVATAGLLWWLIPAALAMPSQADLDHSHQELHSLTETLKGRLHELHETQARLSSVLATSKIILWVLDPAGVIHLVEGRGLAETGQGATQVVGRTVVSLVGTDHELAKLVAKAMAGDIASGEAEFAGRFFESSFYPLRDQSGNLHAINGISTDVTERREAEARHREMLVREQAACESARLKSEFLANMSHEIRTPINGVIGMVDLLLGTPLNDKQRDYAECAQISAAALLTLVNDILDLSKIEAGKLDLEVVAFNLEHLCLDVEKAFRPAAAAKGLSLSTVQSIADQPFYSGDPGRLRQVIANLMSNALKFTEAGGITLTVRRIQTINTHDSLRFEVTDTGVGIPEHILDKLFKAFSQADASTTRRYGGTGLGLSICKHLVTKMDGSIGALSREGVGSTFWVELPLARAVATTRPAPAPSLPRANEAHAGKHILIVDDNPINQKVARAIVEKLGYKATTAANGIVALEALRSTVFHLVLMDCQMPEMDGYEATREIRRMGPAECPLIPIIAMTANAFKDDRDKCLAAGMNDYIAKPVQASELARRIETWMDYPFAQRQSAG